MVLINLFVLLTPLLGTLGALWVQCALIDSLPVNAFKEQRQHLRYGLMFLIIVILSVIVFIDQAVGLIQAQYILPV